MTPQERMRLEKVEKFIAEFSFSDRLVFKKNLQFLDGVKIQTGRGTGTMIGTAADQKVGFHGKSPVVQQATIADPTGGSIPDSIDSQARTAINSILDVLDAYGLTA